MRIKAEMGNYQGREVGLGGGCLSQCVRAKKNFWGPGKFCRLSWDQGFECVTGTGSQKKTFGAPESFVGFCGTRAFTPRPETGSWAYLLTHPLWRASYADVWLLLLCCAEMNKNMPKLRTTGCPPDMYCHKGGRRLLP